MKQLVIISEPSVKEMDSIAKHMIYVYTFNPSSGENTDAGLLMVNG